MSSDFQPLKAWGIPPWTIDFQPPKVAVPGSADFAVVGGGFTGLACAAWLRLLEPQKSVVLFETGRIGEGASGRTGGMALAETAAGDLPGLGDVLAGLKNIFQRLGDACGTPFLESSELQLSGAWEIGRSAPIPDSPIDWDDSGQLRVMHEVPGGTLHPGKVVSGLAECASRLGAMIAENSPVTNVRWLSDGAELEFSNGVSPRVLRVKKVLFATNALSLDLAGFEVGNAPITALGSTTMPRLTLAAATAPISEDAIRAIGLESRKPFYTIDFPYLWGRLCRDNSIVWGAGLVGAGESHDLRMVEISSEEPARMFATLEKRVRGLHPALANVEFTHQWGGPILLAKHWLPVFRHHPKSPHGIVAGAYSGHGVALSSYLGAWAAEVMLGRRKLPNWDG